MLALYDFLEDIRLGERLLKQAEELDEAGDNRSAQILNQLWEILLSALEQLHDVLGETHWEDEHFVRLLRLLLRLLDVRFQEDRLILLHFPPTFDKHWFHPKRSC